MFRLHLSRALLAAAITLSIAPVTILILEIGERLLRGSPPFTTNLLERFVDESPRIVGIFGMLLLMATVPMALLWLLPATRRWFRRSWVAAIAGALCGALLIWPWMDSFSIFFPFGPEPTWERVLQAAPVLSPLGGFAAGLYAFLHAFFVNNAIAKRKWLAEHPEG